MGNSSEESTMMPDTTIENQLHIANFGLSRQIEFHEVSVQEKKQLGVKLQDSEKRYRRLFESAKDGILILDADSGTVVDVNPFLLQLLGYSYHELCGQHIWDLGVFKDIAASKEAFRILQDNEYICYDDLPLETRSGQPIAVEFVSNVYLVDHSKVIQCNIRDITARKRGEEERKRQMAAIEQAGEAIVMTDTQGTIQKVNGAFERMSGYSREEVVGKNFRIVKSGIQDELFYHDLWATISGGSSWAGRIVNKRKDGVLYTVDTTISPVKDASGRIINYISVKRDITDNLRLTAQYQQAQKMEAIGLLAGGVAHDFNNMLTVILGYAELAQRGLDPSLRLYANLQEIIMAAHHSTQITRQLLAFARKQAIIPVVLDLNKAVESMLKMLRRLIGEDIDLAWIPEDGDCRVKMDPVQINQILANLCVNARDAISGVGKVTIETGRTVFDEAYCAQHAGLTAGPYLLLAVSDDGCGMDKKLIAQIFQPFFTSKGVGKGTGLGLSTVYGIVQQNNGFINVYSELGKGTTFKIYLPCYEGQAESIQVDVEQTPSGHGDTVLVVEDEPALLKIAAIMLTELGYRVLVAARPSVAIAVAEEHAGEIRLLITDVVMPEMNGQEVAERMQSLYPDINILFMSGYTANAFVHQGVLEKGVNFLLKPFTMKDLAIKVRNALVAKQAEQVFELAGVAAKPNRRKRGCKT